ncbi:hypothetical protein D3C71_1632350 [compost metagenome]
MPVALASIRAKLFDLGLKTANFLVIQTRAPHPNLDDATRGHTQGDGVAIVVFPLFGTLAKHPLRLDHLITHPLWDRDPDLVRLGLHQRLPAQEKSFGQVDVVHRHRFPSALVPAFRLPGVASDTSMNVKKSEPALIEYIHGLDPDFHEARCRQAHIPAVIRQVGRCRWPSLTSTGTQAQQQSGEQN